jgi:hypothetical protein
MKRVAVSALLLAACIGAAPVGAAGDEDGGGSFLIIGFGQPFVDQWDMNVRFAGSVVVRFSGPEQSGTIVWSPGETGQLTAAQGRTRNGARRFTAFLGTTTGASVTANVVRGGRVCTDRQRPEFDSAAVTDRTAGIRVGLATASPFRAGLHMTETNCGGPLSGDMAGVLPPVPVSRAQLTTGNFDLDLRASGTFAHGDLRGTVESTVTAHVGKRLHPSRDERPPPRAKRTAYRDISVSYKIERLAGTLEGAFAGGTLCDELGSCGDAGTWLLRSGATTGSAYVRTSAVLSRPLVDLRAAVGLTTKGDARGLTAAGGGDWSSRATTLTATVERSGQTLCSDTRRVGGGALQIEPSGRSATVTLLALGSLARTSCPGPAFGEGSLVGSVLATGRIPMRAFAAERVVVNLKQGARRDTDGWAGATRPSLTLVLRRTGVHMSRFTL